MLGEPPGHGEKLETVPMTGQVTCRDHYSPVVVVRLLDARLRIDLRRSAESKQHRRERRWEAYSCFAYLIKVYGQNVDNASS